MLKRIFVDNYKCLVDFELRLHEMSLLLGPNGTGKSAVLGVISALRKLVRGEAKVTDDDVFPTGTLTRWQERDAQAFEIQAVLGDDVFDYRLEVGHDRSRNRARITRETLQVAGTPLFAFEMGVVRLYRDDYSEGPTFPTDWSESALARVVPEDDNRRLCRFVEFLSSIVVCALHPPAFRAESMVEDPALTNDAANYADWFRHVVQEYPDLRQPFIDQLKTTLEGGFQSMRLERIAKETRDLVASFDAPEDGSRYELRFDELSDGQRALIVLYGLVFLAHSQDHALFLDEPDNYLALREIQPWLGVLEEAVGDTLGQAMICSHNPEIIDYLGSDCGIFLAREEAGLVVVDKPDVRDSTDGLKLSEIIARGWETHVPGT